MSRLETWQVSTDATQLNRRGRNPIYLDGFVLGVTEPTPDTNGAGHMPGRAAYGDLTVVNGDVTVAAGEILEDKIIKGRVFLTWHATNPARMRNCEVQGPASPPTSGSAVPLVQINGLPGTMTPTTTQVLVEFVTIRPQTTSDFWDGIGRKGFKTVRCWLEDVNDGWQIFSGTADGIVRVTDEGSCLTRLAQFRPDIAYNNGSPRPETHNDGIQNQGSLDEPDFTGTSINARHSTTRSNPLPPTRTQIAAVMLNSNTQTRAGIKLDRCWIRGGIYSINGGLPSGTVIITDSRFERPGTDVYGDGRAPDRAISLNSGLTKTVTGNVYEDNGATVPVING
jgi:hypothetical protein